jgi:hypothetical protein
VHINSITTSETIESAVFVCADLGCAYRWNAALRVLEWVPLGPEAIVAEDWGPVEEHMAGEERVTMDGVEQSLSDVFHDVERKLTA